MWKRGHKALTVIQQGESPTNSPTSPANGKPLFSDGNKSLGKKLDPALAHLQSQSNGRMSSSQPSSGRNSLDGFQRPKVQYMREHIELVFKRGHYIILLGINHSSLRPPLT